ncbi:tRNA pseudouridine(13) synthase TruD [Candidatus Woesearchaeota archaeon]|nr:tRNA pseudouridine(13) synthase TruD [Candidatus Woesearchaeota archaeon]
MAIIKAIPEDFVVEEQTSVQPGEGRFTLFWLEKKGRTTLECMQYLAGRLGLPLKRFGWAGNKDKQAVTHQLCSVDGISFERLKGLETADLRLTAFGQRDRPVSTGELIANNFRITVRDLKHAIDVPAEFRFLNLFGPQRFSAKNATIGKLLVQRKWKEACTSLEEDSVAEHLRKEPAGFLTALRTLPLKLLRLYVHAYQSMLWNSMAVQLANTSLDRFAMIGFDFSAQVEEVAGRVMAEEGISPKDFLIREFPELSAESVERDLWCSTRMAVLEVSNDELHPGRKKQVLSFTLPKGCYATVAIDALLSKEFGDGVEDCVNAA